MKPSHVLIILLLLTASLQLAFSQSNTLVVYYPFSGNANDMSGNGNMGTLSGGVSPGVDRLGNPNSAYAFNGTGYITVNNSPSLQIGSVWSMAFWFKVGGYGPDSNWMGMVTKARASVDYYAGPREMLSYLNTTSPIRFASMGPPPFVSDTPIPLETNTWYHCTMTSAGDSIRSYLNGDLKFIFPRDPSWTFSNTNPLTIGAQNGSFHNRFFNGSIDEVRIYIGALNQREIDSLYHIVPVMSDTVALWHLDEPSGQNVLDSSPYRNNGIAVGTTIVSGQTGNARRFNGHGDFVSMPPSNSFNFTATQSFTIDAWFKTTRTDTGEIVRCGLAPVPGYLLRILDGRVQGTIGDREDMPLPSMLLRITSTAFYNDGGWHHALLIRDRSQGKLYLYVDDVQATPPVTDLFTLPIITNRPLMMGRWENPTYPTYFDGTIDEVKIFKGARHPESFFAPGIRVSPIALDFGSVLVGTQSQQTLNIQNIGSRDTLRITNITSNDPVFLPAASSLVLPPGAQTTVVVSYTPATARTDTATLSITSNDPNRPEVRIPLHGRGIQLLNAPIITSIKDISHDQGKQVRVIWYRSIYDGINDSLHIGSYNLWRRVDEGPGQMPPAIREGSTFTRNGQTFLYAANELWDFIVTVPAVQFTQYSYVASTLLDSTILGGMHWTAFKVSAHTTTGTIFFSEPDSGYSLDNLPPRPPTNVTALRVTGGVGLAWNAPLDPDIRNYVVHRSTQANFVPTAQTLIGNPSTPYYTDTQVSGLSAVYYKLAAVDSAGNQGDYADEIGLSLTGVTGDGTLPTEFALYQNYPNPFNPVTIINYDVPVGSHVVVGIYDLNGRELDRLVDEWEPAGRYRASWNGNGVSSGVYFYRLIAGGSSFTKKFLLLR